MSPRRSARTSTARRVPYRTPRRRREVWTAVAVACLIVIATASFVWFLRPNRESPPSPEGTPSLTVNPDAVTSTAPTDTTAPTTTAAPSGG